MADLDSDGGSYFSDLFIRLGFIGIISIIKLIKEGYLIKKGVVVSKM